MADARENSSRGDPTWSPSGGRKEEDIMQSTIREAALELGYIDARPVTGHPFELWREKSASAGFKFEHDPVNATGWPLEEITIWVAIAATPSMAEWPEGCGEIGGFYIGTRAQTDRRAAWEGAVAVLGYEIARESMYCERPAAIRAGLGVHALNGLFITPEYGSFVNIDALIVRAAPPTDARGPEHDFSPGCGDCGDCIAACPTGAITYEGYDFTKCLRRFMNFPQDMPESDYPKMGRMIQGCDICQRACPKNAAVAPEAPPADMAEWMRLENLLTKPDFERMSKYVDSFIPENRVKTQAALAAANTGRRDLLPLVEALIGGEDEMLDKIARWAAERLRG